MNWGRAIRIARATRGFTQEDLAWLSGYDKSYISLIETGRRVPSTKAMEKLGKVSGFPMPLLTILAMPDNELERLDDETRSIMGRWFITALSGKTL